MSVSSVGSDRVVLDPVSRVGGLMALEATLDRQRGELVESSVLATMFRGYELILEGRDVRDAVFVSSRACGLCGGAHATCAALACEMAFGIVPPPMAIAARNLMSALEYLVDLPAALFLRAGPDYSRSVVERTTPAVWQQAERTPAPGNAVHGFARIADIMSALSRPSGELYREAIGKVRTAGAAYVVIGGKYPHPQTMVPGGVSTYIDTQDLSEMLLRVSGLLDYAQRVVLIWNDLVDFFYDADPRFRDLGSLPLNFISLGQWDDPLAYDATYENSAEWGERRWATPGAVVDGRLITTSLPEIESSVEEYVDHSFYEQWSASSGRPSPNHPAGKSTIPQPAEASLQGKYSWSTAPRWRGKRMDTGAYAHLWTTALARKIPHRRFIEPTGHSLRLAMPQGRFPATELEWRAPQDWGTLERLRARAYALAYAALVAYEHALVALDFKRTGEDRISTRFQTARGTHQGAGLWGSARGYLSHHITVDSGVIQAYQILSPSTWTISPRDALGHPGPCEQAVNGPFVADGADSGYIDVLRTIRSFDPCVACATH